MTNPFCTDHYETTIEALANIVKYHDIVALESVKGKKIVDDLITRLEEKGYKYSCEISPMLGDIRHECYMFLFRNDKVQIKKRGELFSLNKFQFIRPPYYAGFSAGNFDFILITAHLFRDIDREKQRKEMIQLAKSFEYIQAQHSPERDIILLGSLGLDVNGEGWQVL